VLVDGVLVEDVDVVDEVDVVLVEVDVVDEVDVVLVEVDVVVVDVVVLEVVVEQVVVATVVVVVVPGSPSGAQSSLGALGVTMRDPNWSFTMTGARAAFRHLSL